MTLIITSERKVESLIVETALEYLGAPYRRHWSSKEAAEEHRKGYENHQSGFCCSGLVRVIAKKQGITLPSDALISRSLFSHLKPSNKPWPGNLVFFSRFGFYCDHVGVLTPSGVLHASRSNGKVVISTLEEIFTVYAATINGRGDRYTHNPLGYRILGNP